MSEKKKVKILLSQLEDALEERQDNDRRKVQQPLTDIEDRRKTNRREMKKQPH